MVGPNFTHGPHQGAQKSTTTGTLLSTTSCCQLASVNSTTGPLAFPRNEWAIESQAMNKTSPPRRTRPAMSSQGGDTLGEVGGGWFMAACDWGVCSPLAA